MDKKGKKTQKKQNKWNVFVECCTDSTRNVVFCFFFLYFFEESTNLSDGPFDSSHWQMGIKKMPIISEA